MEEVDQVRLKKTLWGCDRLAIFLCLGILSCFYTVLFSSLQIKLFLYSFIFFSPDKVVDIRTCTFVVVVVVDLSSGCC